MDVVDVMSLNAGYRFTWCAHVRLRLSCDRHSHAIVSQTAATHSLISGVVRAASLDGSMYERDRFLVSD